MSTTNASFASSFSVCHCEEQQKQGGVPPEKKYRVWSPFEYHPKPQNPQILNLVRTGVTVFQFCGEKGNRRFWVLRAVHLSFPFS